LSTKRPYLLFHIIGWIAFFGFQFVLFPRPDILFKNGEPTPFLIDQVIINIISMIFFYLHYFYLIPKLYFESKYLKYALSVFVYITVSLFIVMQVNAQHPAPNDIPTNIKGIPEFSENPLAPPPPLRPQVNTNVVKGKDFLLFGIFFIKLLLVFLLSVGLKIYNRWQVAEEEKYKAELSFLKAQINPHFLFNTLNGLYVLAIKKSENTAPAIMKLSSIMRYVINEGHQNYVDIDRELKYISDYIDLQKMRLANNIQVNFSTIGEHKNYKIAPLILIPFIENAFKHGISTEENCVINIQIKITENNLELLVQNNKYKHVLKEEEKSGIGVNNTQKRLDVLYPSKYILDTVDTETMHVVNLKIQLI
jgi:hypothetical protein